MLSSKSLVITVITVVYNSESYIEKTIESIIGQTHTNIDYIIIDGGSSDGTMEIVKRYSNKSKCISEGDDGIYDAMNKGINISKGSWIIFINAGDTFVDNKVIENFCDYVINKKEIDLIYGDVIIVHSNGKEQKKELKNSIPFLIRNMICHQCIFYSSRVFKEVGLFNTTYKLASDFEHFTKIKWADFRITKIDTVIARYGLDGISAQKTNIKKIWKERMQIFKEANYMPLSTRLLFWFYAKAAYEFRKIF